MPRQTIVIEDAVVDFTLTPPGTPVDYSCQVISAAITPTPNAVDIPATFCAPASQTAAGSSFTLDLTFLQDWGATDSLSQFLYDNDATAGVAFTVSGIAVASGTAVEAAGVCTIVAAAYGGEAGTPLQATASLPIDGKPTIGPGAATLAAESDERTYQTA
jgi:hypothetical protein